VSDNLYAGPASGPRADPALDGMKRRRRFWKRAIWASLLGIIVPPLIGLVGTMTTMNRELRETYETGKAPEGVSDVVTHSLHATVIGLIVSALSLLALIFILIRYFTLPRPESQAPSASVR
jgi:biopolymer transport protein ExbB/TolQ